MRKNAISFTFPLSFISFYLLAGRKCAVDFESQQLPKYLEVRDQLLNENGKIKYWRNEDVYERLSKELGMQPKNIHATITRKSHLIFGRKCEAKKTCEFKEDEPDEEDMFEEFEIELSTDEKAKFEILEGKDRHQVLKFGWTNTMSDILSRQFDGNCEFFFERHSISSGEVSTEAYCECGMRLLVQSHSNFSRLQLKIITVGNDAHDISKRRPLTGDRKEYFREKLKHNNAFNVLNEVAADELRKNPDKLLRVKRQPTKNALNILRSRQRKADCIAESAVTAVRKMKYSPEYADIIKEFAPDLLHLIFWTEHQKFLCTQLMKRNQRVCISIDATGGLISNRSLTSDLKLKQSVKLPHPFMYLIMLKDVNGMSRCDLI